MQQSRSRQVSSLRLSLRLSLHSALSYAFAIAAVSRLCVGCLTGRPPSRTARLGLGVLTASVPLTALPQSLRAPLRWRGVFITSLFTALFVSTALATLDDEGRFTGRWVYIAWAASALQFGHRCARYHLEVEDAERCAEREAFFSMCSFSLGRGIKLPCTILNQAFMVLIGGWLESAAGPDLLVALALSDFLCVFQLFLARQRRFPASLFLEGATLISSTPASLVFAAHGRIAESAVLCGGLAAWLVVGRLCM